MCTYHRFALAALLALTVLGVLASPALAGPADKARLAERQARWQDAADAWTEVLGQKPADKEAAIGLARVAQQGGLLDLYVTAEEALQRVLEKKPADRDTRLALGDLFLTQARSKSDQTAMKFIFEDAKTQFTKLLEANARDEDAAVGLARAHYWTAYFSDALQVLDEFLKGGASKGPALYWKGQVYYLQAQDAYRKAGAIDQSVKGLFRKAMAAYTEATRADPKYFDAWMQYGYAAQYLGEETLEEAEKAYVHAMGLDEESMMPLKGIEALYRHRPKDYGPRLEELSHQYPLNKAVHYYLGFLYLVQEDWDKAVQHYEKYAKTSRTPQAVWSLLGKAYDGQGKSDQALEAFRKALRANPDDSVAAAALEKRITDEHGTSIGSAKDATALLKDYEDLLELSPNNPWIRNNAAFLLREAVGRGQGSGAWAPVLDACVKLYVEASEIVETLIQGREESIPYPQRYQYAGVINDTGLMFYYYPSRKDLEKAEDYYIRALELTNDGYRDAWENLSKVYLEQGRWQEAFDLCRDCSERMTTADGSPHPDRQQAADLAGKLLAEGRVSDD